MTGVAGNGGNAEQVAIPVTAKLTLPFPPLYLLIVQGTLHGCPQLA
jgi:hypothetical protein